MNDDHAAQAYAIEFALYADECVQSPSMMMVAAIKRGLMRGDERFRSLVDSYGYNDGGEVDNEHPWRKPTVELQEKFVPAPPKPPDDILF